jgi:hypothetical protein
VHEFELGFTIFAKATIMLGVSKRPTIICLRTHDASLMKFMTNAKVSNPFQLIHKSKMTLVVAQVKKVGPNTYVSIVLYSMEGICSSINCF